MYMYGECTDLDGEGCTPPIWIDTWPVQERNKSVYNDGPAKFHYPHKDTTFQGLPAIRFPDGALEIFHPDVTIVVSGDSEPQIDRFADALREAPILLTDLVNYGFNWRCDTFPGIEVYCFASR